jgi:hypothetical protein
MEVTVHGPSWSGVDSVQLFANGRIVFQESFAPVRKPGIKFQRKIPLDLLPSHDTAIVAVASGPGVLEPSWEVRKPYQPTSDEWTPRVLGVSQAVWVDRDADGRITSPLAHAERLVAGDATALPARLAGFDRSVTMHVLDLLRSRGSLDSTVKSAFESSSGAVREGYTMYLEEAGRLRP